MIYLSVIYMLIQILPNAQNDIRQSYMYDSSNIRSLGAWTYNGAYSSLVITDTIEYVGAGAGFYIMNISDPSNPVKLREINARSDIPGYSLDSCFLLTAMSKAGTVLYNISDPLNPIFISQHVTPSYAVGVNLVNRVGYIAAYEAGLRIIDYSNPYSPVELGSFVSGDMDALDVCVLGNYAYLANGPGGFRILDISNPTSPFEVGSYLIPPPPTTRACDIEMVNDTIVLVAWPPVGVKVFNVSNPAQPQLLSTIPSNNPGHVVVKNLIAYISDSPVKIVDISDPCNPIILNSLNLEGGPLSIANNNILCINISDSIYPYRTEHFYIDVSNPTIPIIRGTYANFPAKIKGIFAKGIYCYAATIGDGMKIYNASNPQQITFIAQTDSAIHERLFIFDTFAFLPTNARYGGGSGCLLKIISIADPTSPHELGRINGNGIAYATYSKDTLVFLSVSRSQQSPSLDIINYANASQPQVIAQIYNPSSSTWNSFAYDNKLYIAEGQAGLRIVDISNPAIPTDLGRFNSQGWWVMDVYIRYPYAYLADGWLRILNISDPTNIVELSHVPVSVGSWEVFIEGNFAYLTDEWAGLKIFDISNPANPVLYGYYVTPGYGYDVYISNGKIYFADYRGFLILEQFNAGTTETQNQNIPEKLELRISPCPSETSFLIKYKIYKDDYVALDLLDNLGRIKKIIKKAQTLAGNYQLNLNVSDLPAGIYFIRLRQGEQQIVERLVIVK